MPCPSDSAFHAFVSDQLPQASEQEIAAHLEACEACRRRIDALCGGEQLDQAKQNQRTSRASLDDATCPGLEDLQANLYAMVARGGAAEPLDSEHAAEIFRLLSAEQSDDVAGVRLGRFVVRRWLGAGGFGVVFLAYDELLHREVALKLPRAQALAHREVRERFLREAEAAAQLHHPNVVPLFEAGEEQGICYIASAYCPGPTLDAWLAEQSDPVPIEIAVSIVRQLAEAVEHAHSQRVLHRDIKPSNVLLQPNPTSFFALTPKLTDFGLAKLLDAHMSTTGSQGMLGTPRYMAPEQAAGRRAAIGPATDVFALGAVLYELLTEVPPYAGEDHAQTLHRLFYDQVIPPRRLRGGVPRDLEAICLKCLERKAEARYPTARELAEDLRRFEEGRTTRARPIGRLEMLRRWTVRQPALAALLVVISGGLFSLLGIFMAYNRSLATFNAEVQTALRQTRKAQAAVEVQESRLRNLLYDSKIALTHQAVQENDLRQAARLLAEIRAEAPEVVHDFVWRYLWNRVAARGQEIDDCGAEIYDLGFSPRGDQLAACGADGILRIYGGPSFAPRASIATEQGEINAIAFSPDGRMLATAGDDGTIRLWEAGTGTPLRTISAHESWAFGVVFTPDGETLITCGSDPVIRLWDVRSGESRGTLEGHTRTVDAIALSPDGTHLASACSDSTARIWDLASREAQHILGGHDNRVIDVRYSPDGEFLLTGSIDHTLRLWRASDGVCLQVENHVDALASVTFLEGDQRLVAADRGGSIHIWQRRSGDAAEDPARVPLHSWKAHEGRAWEVVVTPDQEGVITAGADGKIHHWGQPPAAQELIEVAEDAQIRDLLFDRQSERLHFIDSGRGVQTWDLARRRQATEIEPSPSSARRLLALGMLPEQVLVMAFADATIEAIELPSRQPRFQLTAPWEASDSPVFDCLAVSHDGRRMAVYSSPHDATLVYDVDRRARLGSFEAYAQAMALSPTGTQLAMSDGDDVVVWDIDRRKRIAHFQGHTSSVVALAFSPDGRRLASGSKDRHVRVWSLAEETSSLMTLDGHRAEVQAVAFSPDGRLLASGDERGELKFWFLAESTELIAIEGSAPIERLVFSPDGNRLAQQSPRQIRIFNATRNGFGGSGSDSR